MMQKDRIACYGNRKQSSNLFKNRKQELGEQKHGIQSVQIASLALDKDDRLLNRNVSSPKFGIFNKKTNNERSLKNLGRVRLGRQYDEKKSAIIQTSNCKSQGCCQGDQSLELENVHSEANNRNSLYLNFSTNNITGTRRNRELQNSLEQFEATQQLKFLIIIDKEVNFSARIDFKSEQKKQLFVQMLENLDLISILEDPPSKDSKMYLIEQKLFSEFLHQIEEDLGKQANNSQSRQFLQKVYPLDIVKSAISSLKSGSILALNSFWKDGIFELISCCLNNWEVYQLQMEKPLVMFSRLIEFKINRFKYNELSLFSLLYPKIDELMEKLFKFFNLKFLNYCHSIQEDVSYKLRIQTFQHPKVTDQLIDLIFLKSNHDKNERKVYFENWDERKKKLSKIVSQKIKSKGILNECSVILTTVLTKTKQIKSEETFSEIPSKIMSNIAKQKLVDTHCLGCSTFFIDSLNIWDSTVNKVPFKVFKSVSYMKTLENQIKNQICMMLNSGGGVILFDGQQTINSISIKGTLLTERNKELLEQRLASYISVFQPLIQAKQSIKITFVPIVTYSSDVSNSNKVFNKMTEKNQLYQTSDYDKEMNYIRGCFALRVVVRPSNSSTLFFWNQNTNKQLDKKYQNYICHIRDESEKEIKMKNIRKQIRKKMKKYYISPLLMPKERKLAQPTITYFDHQCLNPNSGIQIGTLNLKKKFSEDKPQQKYYLNATLVVVKQHQLDKLQKIFEQKGVECKFQVKFKDQNLGSSKHTAIMYHDKSFSEIRKIKEENNFLSGGKPLITINITSYLLFKFNNHSLQHYKNLVQKIISFIEPQFPHEIIKLYRFKVKKDEFEYFIRTESRQSTLLTYYLLIECQEKVLMKNPHKLDMLDQEKRQKLFVEVWRSEPKNENEIDMFE